MEKKEPTPENLGRQKKEPNLLESFKKTCSAEGRETDSTMSETKPGYAERTIRSLKDTLYSYMVERLRIRVHSQKVSVRHDPEFRKNCPRDLMPRNVKNFDFLSILYSKPLREYRKPKFKTGDRLRISRYDLPFKKDYQPQFIQEIFENVAISSTKPTTYTKRMSRMRLSVVIFLKT